MDRFQDGNGRLTFCSVPCTLASSALRCIDDCCESNPGAFAGAIIVVIVGGGLAILSSVACCHFKCCSCCPCNKHNPNATIHPGGDAHIPAC